MDREIARAFLKVAILGQAAKGEVYGLGMISSFEQFGMRISPGTLYPTFKLLVEEGDIIPRKVVVDGKRRIIYKATRKGLAEYKEVRRTIAQLSRAFLALGFLIMAPAQALAGEPVSLPEAVEAALRLDPVLAAFSARQGAAQDRRRFSLAPAEPNFAVTKDFNGLKDYAVSQSLGFPGRAQAAAGAVEAEASVIEAQAARRRAEVSSRVKKAYASLWAARKKREVLALKRTAFAKILEASKRRSVKDTTTEVEHLNSEVTAAQVEDEDADLLAEERSREAALDLLLGRRADQPLELREPAIPAFPPRLDRTALAAAAARSNPSLSEARWDEEVSRRRLSLARWSYLPEFSFLAAVDEQQRGKLSGALTIPLWSWFGERRAASAAKWELKARTFDKSEAERALALELEGRAAELEALGAKLRNHSERLIPLSEKSFKIALANYGYGKVDYNALSAAAGAWFGAQDRYYSLQERYAAAWADLEALIGGPLP